MINLSDFQPLSISKIEKFSSTTGFLLKIFSDFVHAILIKEVTVQTTLRDGASFRRLSSIIEGLRAKRAYIEFWPIFIFCRIELIFGRLTCFDMKSIVA